MTSSTLVLASVLACVGACYWNAECPYLLYSTKTPYETIRGDIRDFVTPENCEAISVWSLNRHGNKNPGDGVTETSKFVASLKDEIVASHEAGRGELCAQDIENFRKWSWNKTLEVTQSYLTNTGYEEMFNIAKRIRERYPHLIQGSTKDYHFRPTNEQRMIDSAIAFADGLTDGTNWTLSVTKAMTRDDVIKSYEKCERYQKEVWSSPLLNAQIDDFNKNEEFVKVQDAVHQRLGITTRLSPWQVYQFYELCRFDRSWSLTYQSPWCAAFSNQDLVVLEYRDDVRHYYRNGYGSRINVKLGEPALRDLLETFEAAVQGQGRKMTAYFTHDTMVEMVWCALGIFKEPSPLQGSYRNSSRVWKTSLIGGFSVNLIAVLNKCQESGASNFKVQFYINEKETDICSGAGCTWQQFQDRFQRFASANLDFCRMEYSGPELMENDFS